MSSMLQRWTLLQPLNKPSLLPSLKPMLKQGLEVLACIHLIQRLCCSTWIQYQCLQVSLHLKSHSVQRLQATLRKWTNRLPLSSKGLKGTKAAHQPQLLRLSTSCLKELRLWLLQQPYYRHRLLPSKRLIRLCMFGGRGLGRL